jgi:hypothetical protein
MVQVVLRSAAGINQCLEGFLCAEELLASNWSKMLRIAIGIKEEEEAVVSTSNLLL